MNECLICGRPASEMTLFQLTTRSLSIRVCETCKDRWVGYGLVVSAEELTTPTTEASGKGHVPDFETPAFVVAAEAQSG